MSVRWRLSHIDNSSGVAVLTSEDAFGVKVESITLDLPQKCSVTWTNTGSWRTDRDAVPFVIGAQPNPIHMSVALSLQDENTDDPIGVGAPPNELYWWVILYERDKPGGSRIRTLGSRLGSSQLTWNPDRWLSYVLNAHIPEFEHRRTSLGTPLEVRVGFKWVYPDRGTREPPLWSGVPKEMLTDKLDARFPGVTITQDDRDTLRQEYFDCWVLESATTPRLAAQGPTIPDRNAFVPMNEPRKKGPYPFGLDGGIDGKLDAIRERYRGRPVIEMDSLGQYDVREGKFHFKLSKDLRMIDLRTARKLRVGGKPVYIPDDAIILENSSYRNPVRNISIGSKYPVTSYHVWGRALDLKPDPATQGVVDGNQRVKLDLHNHLFPTLLEAVREVEKSGFVERGSKPVDVVDDDEDHVHVQWRP